MKTEVVEVSPTRKDIKIEIEAADVRAEFERVTQEYARAVSVPGFRKGHAPVTVVRTRYKKDIQGDVLKRLVPEAVEQAIEDRAAEAGDTVTADIQGHYVEPPEEEDINVEEVDFVLGGEGVLPESTE